jgi:predicted Zn-dependent protease with MMP-like domain
MPELETDEAEFDDNEISMPGQDEYSGNQQEKDPRFLFGAISFVIALLFVIVYFNAGFNSLLLLGTIIFGLIGMLLISSQRREASNATATTQGEQNSGEDIKDTLSPFELLVKEALDSIPPEFQEKMDNVLVQVESEPGEEVLERVGAKEGYVLLGLYEGVPLTAWHRHGTATLPERITIYQRTIEDYCEHNPERIRKQVRNTVLHEVAHHFGMDHEEMPIWVK